MTELQIHETKEKILHSARIIFSQKGFEGTSIRQIATAADVNVAAVNYHFSTKENLFLKVIENVFSETSNHIRQRRNEFPNEKVEELAVWIFEYFLERSDVLRSVFSMMLSENGWNDEMNCDENEKFGPPGGLALAEAIQFELDQNISEADMFWAVKMIFSNIVHLALMYSNHFCKLPPANSRYHTCDVLKEDILRLTRVVLKDLNQ